MFTTRHAGNWPEGAVETRWAEAPATAARPPVPEVEAAIERAWAEALARPGVHLFDGPMCRLESSSVGPDGRLRLVLSATSYKTFLGTNLTHPELADRHGPQVLANPVGVSALLESADADPFLLLGRRNDSVAYYPARVHPFAGALEPRDRSDVFAAVRRELREELSLDPADAADLRCVGLVEDNALRQPELVFLARCRLTRALLESRLDPVEHRGAYAVEANAPAIEAALSDRALTPVAAAALLLWARVRLADGERWFRRLAPRAAVS